MAHAKLLEEFLSAVRDVHATSGGTKETSYYTALNNLLDGAGHSLKPKVRCVMQLKNLGAGNPDGGLFTIGGYQVIKKWLSNREQRVPGRALMLTEIMKVTAMARRLAALVLLQPKLDENYQTVAATTWAFGEKN